MRAIERCDIVILMIDATEGVAEQDAKIAGLADDRGRAMIVVLNKSDLLTRDELDKAIDAHARDAQLRALRAHRADSAR